ncbi:MAG: DUF480 domain-containing protein [Actinobacteria bacterium]|nr:DUF480 domain-containing protein [Actinomycetota bacterium]
MELDAVEQRVIGSLLEKERTVPASYPMTLNALRTACNQSSSREPVVDFDDATILDAVDRLKARGLARLVHASHGARSIKFRQVLDERLDLADEARAVLTVLLLRGPCSAGELKTRTERLHGFADRAAVESELDRLAALDPPLTRELPRQPGQHDPRWIHLLGPVEVPDGAPTGSAPTAAPVAGVTEAVLAEGPGARDERVRAAYDEVAATYADHLADELDAKPFDRWLLERLVGLADGGAVVDVGCGPGHVALHLAAAGAEVTGFDLSPGMVAEARRRCPELTFAVGDLTALPPPPDGSAGWSAIAAWYSLVHLAGSELRPAIASLVAALRPGGWLALAMHLGPEVRRLTEWWDHEVDVSFTLHERSEVLDAVGAAGVVDVEWYVRSPIPGAEVETERLYVLARRPT